MFLTLDSVQFLMKQWLVGSLFDTFSVAVGIAKLYRRGGVGCGFLRLGRC